MKIGGEAFELKIFVITSIFLLLESIFLLVASTFLPFACSAHSSAPTTTTSGKRIFQCSTVEKVKISAHENSWEEVSGLFVTSWTSGFSVPKRKQKQKHKKLRTVEHDLLDGMQFPVSIAGQANTRTL